MTNLLVGRESEDFFLFVATPGGVQGYVFIGLKSIYQSITPDPHVSSLLLDMFTLSNTHYFRRHTKVVGVHTMVATS